MKVQYTPATIIHIIDETAAVKRFFFKMPSGSLFTFKPGQFVILDLPIESKITYRSYSIASAPGDDGIFELVIVLNPDGLGTPYMWQNFKVGDQIPVAGPLGKFVLPEGHIEQELCLIGTGTGIAPLRSMLHHLINHNLINKNIYMIFGNRTQADILYHIEMEALSAKFSSFEFIPVLSRPHSEWQGRRGYVHQIYQEIFSDGRPAMFYLCGWKNMINDARKNLTDMGYDKSQIKFELYD
ncbi:MAG: FAD-binding oxidoreductase [Bacteroidia bacterium]|jgi:CDP-4-dehydro-6-deoxyglucose reductase|nr:FAD-binding oxidoreductase [Bacteroidia bacterium]